MSQNEPALTSPPTDGNLSASDHVDAVAAAMKLPGFYKEDPTLCFCQVELMFASRNITSQQRKFQEVASQLPYEVVTQVATVLRCPGSTPYNTLKERLIQIYDASQEKKLVQLLEETTLGDSKPSQLLRSMETLAGDNAPAQVLKTIWLRALPSKARSILAALQDQSIDRLADVADKILKAEPQVAAVRESNNLDDIMSSLRELKFEVSRLKQQCEPLGRQQAKQRARSTSRDARSRSRGLCYFHSKFGSVARKCRPGCTWSNISSGNSSQ